MSRKKKQQNKEQPVISIDDKEVITPDDTGVEIDVNSTRPWSIFSFPEIENMEAILQEANREFFHPLGLCIYMQNGGLHIEKPAEQPMLEYGDDVKQELENVKTVQKMRVINTNKRIKTHGYRVQPVHLPK